MPQLTDAEQDIEDDEAHQPTLAEMIRSVHKCTASVDTLKADFGGMKKEPNPP